MTAPNTNPSDLDLEALIAELDKAIAEGAGSLAINCRNYLSALPPASSVPEAEAVAWRERIKAFDKAARFWGKVGERAEYFAAKTDYLVALKALLAVAPPIVATEAGAPHAAMCPDCPLVGYSTNSTRCNVCPRKDAAPPPVAAPSGETTDVLLGFASFKDGTFELIVQNKATGEEVTLTGSMTQSLEKIDRILPTCVFVPANISAPLPISAPINWKLVPIEPTKGMLNEAYDLDNLSRGEYSEGSYLTDDAEKRIWKAMVEAAPPSPIASEPKDATVTAAQAYQAGFKAAQVWAKVDEIEAAGKAEPIDARLSRAATFKAAYNIALTNDYPDWLSAFQASEEPWGEPKDAGSGEGQDLSKEETLQILNSVFYAIYNGGDGIAALQGYRITRTAPSGAKPGEVG